ncbi:MAG: MBL fold metallo-hydrolase [Arenimonas sp.]|nr:MBL fold metallo-hydrolase [Arenimonas sp.]
MSWALRFLGVGNAHAAALLGSASAVIECDGVPLVMVDCGQEALAAFEATYAQLPDAVFITHVHMDHVAGLERLFFATYFDPQRRGRVRLYVPVGVLPHLQSRLADYPGVVAEGDANWWDAFQLVPVTRGFWHRGQWYEVFPVRHHLPGTAFGLRLPGSVVWTGDTRPIPETLARHADAGEWVAHDCGLQGNPSHSGIDELEREYPAPLLARCVLYHYASLADGEALRARGHRVARPGERLPLSAPLARPEDPAQ